MAPIDSVTDDGHISLTGYGAIWLCIEGDQFLAGWWC